MVLTVAEIESILTIDLKNWEFIDSMIVRFIPRNNDISLGSIVEKIWDIWLETNDTEIEKDFYRGIEFLRIGDYTQSIYFLTQVIKKNPNFSEAWNKRATVYFMMGNFDKSMYDIKQTLDLEPRHFGAMDGMGLIFMHM